MVTKVSMSDKLLILLIPMMIISLWYFGYGEHMNLQEMCMNSKNSWKVSNSSDISNFRVRNTIDGYECCGYTEKTYERDIGTLSYFLQGKKGYYRQEKCVPLE